MSYVDKNLMANESVLYRAKLHWIVFKWSIIWSIIAIALFTSNEQGPAGGALVLAGFSFILAVINFISSEFGLTNKRVLMKTGFIKRSSIEVLLNKVEGIQVNQGIIGRMLGYGTVVVSGTGGMQDPFHKIANPLKFRKKVQEQIAAA